MFKNERRIANKDSSITFLPNSCSLAYPVSFDDSYATLLRSSYLHLTLDYDYYCILCSTTTRQQEEYSRTHDYDQSYHISICYATLTRIVFPRPRQTSPLYGSSAGASASKPCSVGTASYNLDLIANRRGFSARSLHNIVR